MFERYTEKARRVIFFARYEASQFGSPYIETEHLLLGLLREDKALTNRFLRSHASVESIRKQIEAHTTIREKVSTSVDLPLSNECKRVLAYAAEEAERLGHKHIGTEHLLLGLLRGAEAGVGQNDFGGVAAGEKFYGDQSFRAVGVKLLTVGCFGCPGPGEDDFFGWRDFAIDALAPVDFVFCGIVDFHEIAAAGADVLAVMNDFLRGLVGTHPLF